MYFLVNASPKQVNVATSIFVMVWRVLGNILCNYDPKVKAKHFKNSICYAVPVLLSYCLTITVSPFYKEG